MGRSNYLEEEVFLLSLLFFCFEMDEIITLSALGRSFTVGDLYDYPSDQIKNLGNKNIRRCKNGFNNNSLDFLIHF